MKIWIQEITGLEKNEKHTRSAFCSTRTPSEITNAETFRPSDSGFLLVDFMGGSGRTESFIAWFLLFIFIFLVEKHWLFTINAYFMVRWSVSIEFIFWLGRIAQAIVYKSCKYFVHLCVYALQIWTGLGVSWHTKANHKLRHPLTAHNPLPECVMTVVQATNPQQVNDALK